MESHTNGDLTSRPIFTRKVHYAVLHDHDVNGRMVTDLVSIYSDPRHAVSAAYVVRRSRGFIRATELQDDVTFPYRNEIGPLADNGPGFLRGWGYEYPEGWYVEAVRIKPVYVYCDEEGREGLEYMIGEECNEQPDEEDFEEYGEQSRVYDRPRNQVTTRVGWV